jgi:hypothetical protein
MVTDSYEFMFKVGDYCLKQYQGESEWFPLLPKNMHVSTSRTSQKMSKQFSKNWDDMIVGSNNHEILMQIRIIFFIIQIMLISNQTEQQSA